MEGIRDTVLNVMQSLAAKKTGASDDGPEAWLEKALTKKEMSHIKVHYFKKGILGLHVDSSAWLYKLNLQKEGILEKINRDTGLVKDIKFRIGALK